MTDNTAPVNDVTTVAGFLAVLDDEIQRLSFIYGWCDNGPATAYAKIGITGPEDRSTGLFANGDGTDAIIIIPDEDLSDAGKTRKAEASAGVLTRLRDGVKDAYKYLGLHMRRYDITEADLTLTALGISVPVRTTATQYEITTYIAANFTGDLTDSKRTQLEDDLNTAASELLASRADVMSASERISTSIRYYDTVTVYDFS
jgi:hypothetical protein